jgi:hypothetical protein
LKEEEYNLHDAADIKHNWTHKDGWS